MDNSFTFFEKDVEKEIKKRLIFDLTSELLNDHLSGKKFQWGKSILNYSKGFNPTISYSKIEFGKINFNESHITIFPDGAFVAQNIGLTYSASYFDNCGKECTGIGLCNLTLEGHYFWPEKKITYINPVHFQAEDEPICTDPYWIDFKKRYCREDALAIEIQEKFDIPLDVATNWIKDKKLPDIAQEKIETYGDFYQFKNNIAKIMFNHCT